MKTILQVEDDPNDVFFLQKAMRKMEVTNPVHVASDGQQAIDYLQGAGKFGDRGKFPLPCLILLDLKLPQVMGLEVLKWIRNNCVKALPVIIMTASAEERDIATAYSLGANAFLTKPSEAGKLDEIVKSIKDFWLTHNMLPLESWPESPPKAVVDLGRISMNDFVVTRLSSVNGVRSEICQPSGRNDDVSELP